MWLMPPETEFFFLLLRVSFPFSFLSVLAEQWNSGEWTCQFTSYPFIVSLGQYTWNLLVKILANSSPLPVYMTCTNFPAC